MGGRSLVSRVCLCALAAVAGGAEAGCNVTDAEALHALDKALSGDLLGRHLTVVTVHDPPFVDVPYDDDGLPLDPAYWTGICMDLLETLSQRTNFTYTLQLPRDTVEGVPNSV